MSSSAAEFAVRMQVRDSELDQYSVVNNAVYNHYLQHARHKWLEHIGGDPDAVARSGDALALSALNISYRQALRSRDRFVATVSVERVTGARVFLRQQIRLLPTESSATEALVLEAEAVVVWLDSEYRPKRIPTKMVDTIKCGNQQPCLPHTHPAPRFSFISSSHFRTMTIATVTAILRSFTESMEIMG